MGCRKHSPGKPCCTTCCDTCSEGLSTNDDAFYHLEFESLDGLHPVSFEADMYVVSECNRTTGGTYGGFNPLTALPPDPIHQTSGFSCDQDYIGDTIPADALWDAPKQMADYIENCCFVGFAAPADGDCKSTGLADSYAYSDSFVYTDETETVDDCPGAGGFRHTGPDVNTFVVTRKASIAARRRVEGVTIKACYINDEFGDRKLELTAIVTYQDHIATNSVGYYSHKVEQAARAALNNQFDCSVTIPASSATTFYLCGDADPHTIPADVDIPDRDEDCLCKDASTSGTCTTETIVRKIVLDPDCTIKGTHVFASGVSPSPKVLFGCGCPTTSFGCYWKWPTPDCPIDSPRVVAFPTAYYTTFPTGWSSRVITTPSSPSTTDRCQDKPVLMYYWTEDWTITIT